MTGNNVILKLASLDITFIRSNILHVSRNTASTAKKYGLTKQAPPTPFWP
jgi:hypothetical protein